MVPDPAIEDPLFGAILQDSYKIIGLLGKGGMGTVYHCLADAAGVVEQRHVWPFERDRVRQFATWQALDLVRRRLLGSGP